MSSVDRVFKEFKEARAFEDKKSEAVVWLREWYEEEIYDWLVALHTAVVAEKDEKAELCLVFDPLGREVEVCSVDVLNVVEDCQMLGPLSPRTIASVNRKAFVKTLTVEDFLWRFFKSPNDAPMCIRKIDYARGFHHKWEDCGRFRTGELVDDGEWFFFRVRPYELDKNYAFSRIVDDKVAKILDMLTAWAIEVGDLSR